MKRALMLMFRWQFFLAVLAISFFFLFFTPKVIAVDIVINEFMGNPNSGEQEWIEFYNPNNIDMTTYWIDDDTNFDNDSGSSAKKSLSSIDVSNQTFHTITLSSSILNNTCDNVCDYVVLFTSDGSIIDQYQYTADQINEKGKTIGRSPDGSSNWVILESITKGAQNSSPLPTPTPTLIPTSLPTDTPTPTRTPTPTKTPTPAPTARLTSTPTPTKVPTSISSNTIAPTDKEVVDSTSFPTAILGANNVSYSKVSNQLSPTPFVKTLGSSQNNISKIFIGLGVIFLIACGILAFKSYKERQEESSDI